MAYYANVTFTGVSQVVDFQGTLSHGITPSVFRLTIVPQVSSISTQGDLVLTWTDFTTTKTLTFADCIVDTGSLEYDKEGALASLSIFDRRWKWRFGYICGRYNLRDAAGKLTKADVPVNAYPSEDTERTPQQLATLLLDAMGETGYDIADLPADPRPKAEWDYVNPASALAELCEELKFRIVLQIDGTVSLRKAGEGAALPTSSAISISTEIDPPERPDFITVVTGRTRFQYDLKLKAVGLDVDGRIKPIDDLSYKPGGGWILGDTTEHLELADEETSGMAKKSVFRWYQIDVENFALTLPPFVNTLNRRWLIGEITDEQNTVGVEDGGTRPRQAWVFGVWYREHDREAGNTGNGTSVRPISTFADDQIVDRNWSYDHKRKMVKFSQSVWKLDGNNNIVAPDLRIRVAFYASDPVTRCNHRVVRTRDKRGDWGTNDTKELVLHHDHLIPTYTASFVTDFSNANTTWTDNLAEINNLCDTYIDEEVDRIDNRTSSAMTYAGFLLDGFDLDGAITQVSWQRTTGGASTKIYRNNDSGSRTTVSYDERRIYERQRLHGLQLSRQQKVGDIEPQKMVMWE